MGVIEYGLHWSELEAARGVLDFSIADRLVAFGQDSGMTLRASPLIWANQSLLPNWLKNQSFSSQEMEEILRSHISKVMSRYRGAISEWCVVGEPYKAPRRVRRDDIFFDAIGDDYVRIAFDEARKTDPDATLILNDNSNHSASWPGVNFTSLDIELLSLLKAGGLVDDKFALGVQGHFSEKVPGDIPETLRVYGVRIMATELDVDIRRITGSTDERYQVQAELYGRYLEYIEASGTCHDYTFWGIGDKHSWLEHVEGVKDPIADATLFDDDLNPKPAYHAVKKFLAGLPSKSSTS